MVFTSSFRFHFSKVRFNLFKMLTMSNENEVKLKHDRGKLLRMPSVSSIDSDNNDDEELYKEIFFIENGSQSNIYCNTTIRYPSRTQERFLVGTLKGNVSCLERYEDLFAKEKFHSSHSMQSRQVCFSYIPADAEIISMDAFYQKGLFDSYDCLIVGITIIMKNKRDGENLHFLNIYNAIEPEAEFEIDKLAQVCQHIQLGFIPYQLRHTTINSNGISENVFLLAGSDQQIHVFRCNDKQNFEEHPCDKYFLEFVDLPGLVLWMDIKNYQRKRLSAVGCDNGQLLVSVCDTETNTLVKSWSLSFDGPISSVCFFTLTKPNVNGGDSRRGSKSNTADTTSTAKTSDKGNTLVEDGQKFHLLVTSCLEVSAVFLDVLDNGLDEMNILNHSDQYDSVTCSCVADIDFDGRNEIILGTYGQELLIYKWEAVDNGLSSSIRFKMIWSRSFSKPLLSINDLDMMNDGMQELVVVSLTGVHILQQNVSQAAETLLEQIAKAFPNKETIETFNRKFNQTMFLEDFRHDHDKSEHPELEGVIDALCSTNNSYNEIK